MRPRLVIRNPAAVILKGDVNGDGILSSVDALMALQMSACTRKKNGRVILRWEHEGVLDDMGERAGKNKDLMKKRKCMCEHPFGTMKRGFNQGYFLLKGLTKVGGEMGLTMLAYNMRRVINILGVAELMGFFLKSGGWVRSNLMCFYLIFVIF